jgi:hypothetical protein
MPDWFPDFLVAKKADQPRAECEDRMAFVLRLWARNISEKSGGSFAAAVFERDSGKLVAAVVNPVLPCYQEGGGAIYNAGSG